MTSAFQNTVPSSLWVDLVQDLGPVLHWLQLVHDRDHVAGRLHCCRSETAWPELDAGAVLGAGMGAGMEAGLAADLQPDLRWPWVGVSFSGNLKTAAMGSFGMHNLTLAQ